MARPAWTYLAADVVDFVAWAIVVACICVFWIIT